MPLEPMKRRENQDMRPPATSLSCEHHSVVWGWKMASLGDRIAAAVLQQFDSLKPRGKPQGREWSVLAGVVVQDTTVTTVIIF